MSHLLHKVKDAVTGNKDGHGATPHNVGPHSSNLPNKTDPLDNPTSTTSSATLGSDTTHHTAGPHGSDLANKLDPRVHTGTTSNLTPADAGYGTSTAHANNAGYDTSSSGVGHGIGTGHTLSHATTSSATPGSGTTHHTAGPHDSNLANKLDPRVPTSTTNTTSNLTPADVGYGTSSTGVGHGVGHGVGMGHTVSHPTTSSATPSSGTTRHTAGPHDSDLANKLDPRVDSDMDGSKTFGGNQTGI